MTTTIKEYSKTESAIAELKEKYGSLIIDCSTSKGLESHKKDYRAIRKYEIELDKKRKELGEEARKHVSNINYEAKRINESLQSISGRFKSAIEDREAEIKEAEEKAKKIIDDKISGMRDYVEQAVGMMPADISGMMDAVSAINCNDGSFGSSQDEASCAQRDVLSSLGVMLEQAISSERQQEELDASRKTEQLNSIKMTVVDAIDLPSCDISTEIDRLRHIDSKDNSVADAIESTIQKLEKMHSQKLTEETEAAEYERNELAKAEAVAKAKADKEREALDKQIAIDAAESAMAEKEAALRAAEERRIQDIKDAEDRINKENEAREQKRLASEEKAREDDEKRAANKRHCGKINRAILNAMIEAGCSELSAMEIIKKTAKGEIPNLTITY